VTSADGFTIRHGGESLDVVLRGRASGDGGRWEESRRLAMGEATVLLEDLDTYRDCHDWKAAERLTSDEADLWRKSLADAWAAVQADAPSQAGALAVGLLALVPLLDDPAGMLRSSTARQAFGSVAIARADPAAMAVMLVHEFQHNILGAVLDLCDLYDLNHVGRIKVEWRTDLRPVEGVLQGTYAHLSIADMWRHRAERPGATAEERAHYAKYVAWTQSAIGALISSGALTAAGKRFVGRMAETLASWSR
jgi:uncharacterized protein